MTALMSMFAFVSMIGAVFGEHVVLSLLRCCCIAFRRAEDSSSPFSVRCRYEPHKWMGVITCECGKINRCSLHGRADQPQLLSLHHNLVRCSSAAHVDVMQPPLAGGVPAGYLGKCSRSSARVRQHHVVCVVEAPAADSRLKQHGTRCGLIPSKLLDATRHREHSSQHFSSWSQNPRHWLNKQTYEYDR